MGVDSHLVEVGLHQVGAGSDRMVAAEAASLAMVAVSLEVEVVVVASLAAMMGEV